MGAAAWALGGATAALALSIAVGKWLRRVSAKYPRPGDVDDPLERLWREGDPK